MVDSQSSNPVRTQNNGDVVAQIVDGTVTTQKLTVDAAGKISTKTNDGSGTAITSTLIGSDQALDVHIANTSLPVTSASDLTPATQAITTLDTATTSSTNFNGQVWYTGTPTTGSAATFILSSNETGMIETTGTWTGTLQVEISNDNGTNWIAHAIHQIGSSAFVSSFTANVTGSLNLAAKTEIRVRAIAAITGSATIKLILSDNASSVYVANAIKVVDGSSVTSSTLMNILAASTAASTANTAVVVAFSPNTPLPAGTALLGSVNQGTSPWIVKDQADGPVTPGTVALFSQLIGGQFNSTLPTLTTGEQSAIQVDAAGRLLIGSIFSPLPAGTNVIGAVTQSGGPWTQNLTEVGGVAIALGQTTMVASLPVTIASNQTPLAVTQSTSPWITSDLADGPVIPGTVATKSILIGGQFNTVLPTLTTGQQAAAQLDSSGRILVGSIASPLPAGTNLLGGTNVYVGGTIASNTNPVPVIIADPTLSGTQVNKYLTSATLAAGSSVTLSYTITSGKTFTLKQIWASAPGKIRADVQTSPDGATFTTFWTSFNSAAFPNIQINLGEAFLTNVGNGTANIQVVITNDDIISLNIVTATITGSEQ